MDVSLIISIVALLIAFASLAVNYVRYFEDIARQDFKAIFVSIIGLLALLYGFVASAIFVTSSGIKLLEFLSTPGIDPDENYADGLAILFERLPAILCLGMLPMLLGFLLIYWAYKPHQKRRRQRDRSTEKQLDRKTDKKYTTNS